MKLKIIFSTLLALCISLTGFASDKKYVKGYIITADNELVKGHIMLRDVVHNCKRVVFKHEDGEVKTYTAKDLRGYKADNHRYISQQFSGNTKNRVFMKQVHSGKAHLYVHYVDDKRAFSKRHKSHHHVYLHEDDYHHKHHNVKYAFYIKNSHDTHFTRLHRKKFKWQLAEFFGPYKAWHFVHDNGFEYKKIAQLVDYFNSKHALKKPKF